MVATSKKFWRKLDRFHLFWKCRFYVPPKAALRSPKQLLKTPEAHLKRVTPLCASVISPACGIRPPPAMAFGEIVWCGWRKGRLYKSDFPLIKDLLHCKSLKSPALLLWKGREKFQESDWQSWFSLILLLL